jgi:hypothetical protein
MKDIPLASLNAHTKPEIREEAAQHRQKEGDRQHVRQDTLDNDAMKEVSATEKDQARDLGAGEVAESARVVVASPGEPVPDTR